MSSKASSTGKSGTRQRSKATQALQQRKAPGNAQGHFNQLQARMGYQAASQMMLSHATANAASVQAQTLSTEDKHTEIMQAKLTMGQPGDKYEKEADQAAAQVVADKPVQTLSKVPATGLSQPLDIQSKEDAEVQMEAEDEPLQPSFADPSQPSQHTRPQTGSKLEKRLQTPQPGRPLSPKIQRTMGEKFNSDFSHVRVHDNSQAQADTASLGAKAFTKGNDIWLGAHASENDQELMAHELAHVVQQNAAIQKTPIQLTPDEKLPIQTTSASDAPVQRREETEESSGILGTIAGFFREIPGYHLLSVVIGRDPISGVSVERNPANVIHGIVGLIPGGNQLYENLNQTGAIDKAGAWLSEQLTILGLTWEYIKGLFSSAWDALRWYDLAPWRAFNKVKTVFAEPLGRLFDFAKSVGGKIMEFVLEAALSLAGSAGKIVMGILRKAGDVFMQIINDPIAFLNNLVAAVKQGFGQFSSNILTHLKTGLIGWLFGALSGAGLQLPNSLGLKGILSIVMQVLDFTWAVVRRRIVKVIGEKKMARIEKTISFVSDLITHGPIAAWELISGAVSNLKNMVLGAIENWVVTKVVKSAVTKLISMFNPAGAIIQAALAIYNTVMFFVERAQQIAVLFKSVTDSIGKIAAGAVGGAATFIEMAMARTIPVIISFLARLMNLGGIGKAIKNLIEKIRKPISNGIDKVVSWVVKKAKALFGKGKNPGQEDSIEGETDNLKLAKSAAEELAVPNADSKEYNDIRKAKIIEAQEIENKYSNILSEREPRLKLNIDFEEPKHDQEDNDLDFTVTISPNDTVFKGQVVVAEEDGSLPPRVDTHSGNVKYRNDEKGKDPSNEYTHRESHHVSPAAFADTIKVEFEGLNKLLNTGPWATDPYAEKIAKNADGAAKAIPNSDNLSTILIHKDTHREGGSKTAVHSRGGAARGLEILKQSHGKDVIVPLGKTTNRVPSTARQSHNRAVLVKNANNIEGKEVSHKDLTKNDKKLYEHTFSSASKLEVLDSQAYRDALDRARDVFNLSKRKALKETFELNKAILKGALQNSTKDGTPQQRSDAIIKLRGKYLRTWGPMLKKI